MNWGIELWDQFDNVDKHCQHGIEFVEKYAKFVKERTAIEQEYASKLRRLAKNYQPKKRHEDRNCFSSYKAFQSQLSELNDLAGQHEIVAETMVADIVTVSNQFCNEGKQDKKKFFQEGKKLQTELDKLEQQVERTKKIFEKEWKESERLHANYERLDNDNNATKADVEKAKNIAQCKKDHVEHCKTDYGALLVKFNEQQKSHYERDMPEIFNNYCSADEGQIKKVQEFMLAYAHIDSKVKPIIQKCLDEMEKAGNAINPQVDSEFVVEKLKSGFPIPQDKDFEDYTKRDKNSDSSSSGTGETPKGVPNANRKGKVTGLSWLFGNKKPVESPDFSHLPPEQRKKKLLQKITEINSKIKQEEGARSGLIRMCEVYKANNSLGDPKNVQRQIVLANQLLEKLNMELKQHEVWYSEATGSAPPASKASVAPPPSRPAPPTATTPGSVAPSAGGIPAPPSLANIPAPPPINNTPVEDEQSDEFIVDEFDEDETAEACIGTCTAQYDYEASSEGEMTMKCGEVFQVLEADSGDGWTRIVNGDEDGYVPTTYIEITFYS